MTDPAATCHECGHSFEAHLGHEGCGLCDCRRVYLPPRERKGRKPKRTGTRTAPKRARGGKPAEPRKVEAPPEPPPELPF